MVGKGMEVLGKVCRVMYSFRDMLHALEGALRSAYAAIGIGIVETALLGLTSRHVPTTSQGGIITCPH